MLNILFGYTLVLFCCCKVTLFRMAEDEFCIVDFSTEMWNFVYTNMEKSAPFPISGKECGMI